MINTEAILSNIVRNLHPISMSGLVGDLIEIVIHKLPETIKLFWMS